MAQDRDAIIHLEQIRSKLNQRRGIECPALKKLISLLSQGVIIKSTALCPKRLLKTMGGLSERRRNLVFIVASS